MSVTNVFFYMQTIPIKIKGIILFDNEGGIGTEIAGSKYNKHFKA